MASLVVSGDTSGTITLSAPLVAGSNTATLPASTGTVALTSDVIGVNQNWTAFTSPTRVAATTYTNSTGKPIQVFISANNVGASVTVTVSGVLIFSAPNNSQNTPVAFIVPNGGSYILTAPAVNAWAELR